MFEVKYTSFFQKPAVFDANVIIDLIEIGALPLLGMIFSSVYIPESMLAFELKTVDLSSVSYTPANITTAQGYAVFSKLGRYSTLSDYDRTVLAIAVEGDLVCVANDKPMRRVCEEWGLSVTGTLGILGCAKQMSFISVDELAVLVDKLEQGSCYLKKDLLIMFRSDFGLVEKIG